MHKELLNDISANSSPILTCRTLFVISEKIRKKTKIVKHIYICPFCIILGFIIEGLVLAICIDRPSPIKVLEVLAWLLPSITCVSLVPKIAR